MDQLTAAFGGKELCKLAQCLITITEFSCQKSVPLL